MSDDTLWLVAGLGNPGRKYSETRHNIGFKVVDEISNVHSIPLNKSKFDAEYGRGKICGVDVILVQPMAFMNLSGPPLQKLSRFFGTKPGNMIVIHDDIDLAFGRLKIKENGGHGGHNGLRSIKGSFGTGDFSRIRVGVGRPDDKSDVSDFVLGKFDSGERKDLDFVLGSSRDAVETLLKEGINACMNSFNQVR